jgi:hypothetical protein
VASAVERIGETLLPHPHGCPRTNFCGCGASVEVFGKSIRSLWPARNWYKFPSASPAPEMAGVKPHHVVILKRHVRGTIWVVYDANSGYHRTRLHQRNIAGFKIVNPHGTRYAMGDYHGS